MEQKCQKANCVNCHHIPHSKQMSELKVNVVLFPNDKQNSKTHFKGFMKFTAEELSSLFEALERIEPTEYGNIELPMSGWLKKTKSGKQYVSAVAEAPEESRVNNACESLAKAFPGSVIIEDIP